MNNITMITSQISKKTRIESGSEKISGKITIGIRISERNIMNLSEKIESTISLRFPLGSF
jgi:hypothetical protein